MGQEKKILFDGFVSFFVPIGIRIETTKKKLEAQGYFASIKGSDLLLIGNAKGPMSEEIDILLIELYCFISKEASGEYLIPLRRQ